MKRILVLTVWSIGVITGVLYFIWHSKDINFIRPEDISRGYFYDFMICGICFLPGMIYVGMYSKIYTTIPCHIIAVPVIQVYVMCIAINVALQSETNYPWAFSTPRANLLFCIILLLGSLIPVLLSGERFDSYRMEMFKYPMFWHSGWISGRIFGLLSC